MHFCDNLHQVKCQNIAKVNNLSRITKLGKGRLCLGSFDNNENKKEAHKSDLNSLKLLSYIMARINYVLLRRYWTGFV
jgi:hypothetical protein